QEALGEERALALADALHRLRQRRRIPDRLADAVAKDLRVEELLGVLPFVERARLVQPLVALQADQRAASRPCRGQRELGLPHPPWHGGRPSARPVARAGARARPVFPTPAGPSTSTGFSSRVARKTEVTTDGEAK